jgi:Plasmid pRiA4b ORF-3-like protein
MIFQFKIQLRDISKPPIWRTVIIPGSFTFHRFHLVIQAAFGWEDRHLYEFSEKRYKSDLIISLPSEDNYLPVEDSQKMILTEIFNAKGQKYTYIYDLGDDWVHKIILEEIIEGTADSADCINGKGYCPPKDCGGPAGYEQLKAQGIFDPLLFDIKQVKQRTKAV